MPDTPLKGPSRGRLFKLFTDIGPYFRQLQSDEENFFFDCLEICVDDKKEPEDRTFIGWWLLLKRSKDTYSYERVNGLYDNQGKWISTTINKKQMAQLDKAFDVFIIKLGEVVEVELNGQLSPL